MTENNDHYWKKSHPCPVCNKTIAGAKEEENYRAYCSVTCAIEAHPDCHPDPEKRLTKIPVMGWDETHDGQKVRLKMPMGTIIEDEIIGLPLENGVMLFGPSQELGMILARASYAMAAQEAANQWANAINNAVGEDGEDWA